MHIMRATRLPRVIVFLTTVVFLACLLLLFFGSGDPGVRNDGSVPGSFTTSALGYGERHHGWSSASRSTAGNETLGFGKVLVVGLPERSDKRDALTLMSSLTGFDIEWVAGVKGESVVEKARPYGSEGRISEAYLGSWRGHMNAVRKIVEEGLPSALIMEDDMDWDIRLKPQLELVAQGARALLPSASSPSSSPYGSDWDLLWLGHCGEPFPETLDENAALPAPARAAMSRKYAILNDATVPAPRALTGLVDFAAHPPHTRWVHVTAAPMCTFAYALSQRGARRVLYGLGVEGVTQPFDNALAGFCRRAVDATVPGREGGGGLDAGLGARCLSVTPPLFFHHRAKGAVAGDSDINVVKTDDALVRQGKDGERREKGSTENILWSMRLNLENILTGRPIESQF